MKQANLTLTALLALALAACQQPVNDTDIAIDNQVNAAEAADAEIEMLPPSEESGAPTVDNSNTPATLPTQIPAQYRGRWGLVATDCTSTKGDAKGLLTINDVRLSFYESRGTLTKVFGTTADSFDARYGFVGEGQTWNRTERLKLVGGKLQRRTDAESGQEPPVNLTYERCA